MKLKQHEKAEYQLVFKSGEIINIFTKDDYCNHDAPVSYLSKRINFIESSEREMDKYFN